MTDSTKTSRILIVDDHPVFLQGLAMLIETEPDLEVLGRAVSLEEAKQVLREVAVDVVVLDLTLEGDSGLDLLRWMADHALELPVLVASMHEDVVYAERSLASGACGYVTKKRSSAEILAALRRVLAGERYLDPEFPQELLRGDEGGRALEPIEHLTAREFEVFEHIGRGLGTAEIAHALHRSVKTIESHRAAIKRKLGLTSAVELVRYATLWSRDS